MPRRKKDTRPPAPPAPLLHCSFCKKSQADVDWLIAGPGVFICNECVELCSEIIAEQNRDQALRAKPPGETSGPPTESPIQ